MRRWFLRISIGLVILLVLVIAVVQIVLWSPLPRRIALQQIEKSLGLRISADSLSVSWLGSTQLGNVSLGLPLSKEDFLKVRALKIKHNTLIGLALGRAVSVDSIEIDNAVIEVRQDDQGRWNLQQVAELLAKAGGANTAQQSKSNDAGVPKLPMIRLINSSVHVSDNQKHTLALEPLNVIGQPDGSLVYQYDATIAQAVHVQGRVAPGGNWQHSVTLTVQDLDSLLHSWGVTTTYAAVVKASWAGQFADGKVTGTLALQQVTAKAVPTFGDVTMTGSIDLQSAGPVLILHPDNLNLATGNVTVPNIGIQSGSIVSDGTGVHADSVKISALGGVANLDAGFDPRTQAVDLKANWSGLSLAKQTSQTGSITASLRQPFAGQPVIKLDLVDAGTMGDPSSAATPSHWNARLNLTGQGKSWKEIDWVLSAPELSYGSGSQSVDFSQTSAHVRQNLPVIQLTDLSLPTSAGRNSSANFSSTGIIDLAKKAWNFDAAGGFSASYQETPVPITLALHLKGNGTRADLTSFVIGVADLTVTTDGSYDTLRPTKDKPVDLHVQLTQQQRITPDALIQGEIAGDFNIVGVLFTDDNHFRPYLTTTGDLRSSDLVLLNRLIGDVDIKLTGTTSAPKKSGIEFGPITTELHTTDFYLFQAPWSFTANYPNADQVFEAQLETHKLPLAELARFAKVDGISGQLADAKWTAKITSPGLAGIDLQSEYHLVKPTDGSITADTVDATATLHQGVLQLDKLQAKNGDGTITTTASVDLRDLRHLLTETTVDRWPYSVSGGVTAQVSAHNVLDVDLRSKKISASGMLTASADLKLAKASLSHIALSANIQKRVFNVEKLSGKFLTGSVDGSFAVDFDKPLQASGQIVWKNVDGASFATIIPALDGAGGQFSGAITLAPARDPRPLEPVRIDINVASVNGHFRSLRIGGDGLLAMHAIAYANTDRVVLDHSDVFLAGGAMHLWGRADDRYGRGLSTQAVIDFDNLDLDQIAHVDPKITKPMPGRLNGQIGIVRSGTHIEQVLGSAHVNLTRSDLVNFGPLTFLYNLMNAAGGVNSDPTGTGTVDATFEQNVVRVNRFQFFNRGIDAHGLFNVGPLDWNDFNKTRVNGQVVGAYRALKGTRVQVLSDFDLLFTAVAGQLTTVNISGPLDDLKYAQATLADIGAQMQELIVGDARANAPH